MPYPQISPILDFTVIDSHNPLTIAIADTSFYPSNFSILNPTLEITPPAFVKATVTFTPSSITVFNSNTLNLTCVSNVNLLTTLPDGIWKVKMSISPPITFNIERTFIRTTQLEQKFGKALLKTDITQCGENIKREHMKVLDEIYFYIQASIAAANQCNNILAMNLMRMANTMLDNFLKGVTQHHQPTIWW